MTPKELLAKATLTVQNLIDDGGYLNPEQAERFIRDVQDQPTIISDIRVVPMTSPVRIIENLGFGARILHAATSGTELGSAQRAKPSTGKITLTTKETIAEVNIPYDVLEDNIERGNLEDTIMDMIIARASLDLDELVVLGDDDSGDDYLAMFDGALKMATEEDPTGVGTGGDYSCAPAYRTLGIGGAGSAMGRHVFKRAIQIMPNKYLRNRGAMRFYVSPNNELDYRDTVADRQTALGDQTVQRWVPLTPFGVPLIPATFVPDDTCLFTDPLNLIMGIQRDILIETDRIIRERVIVIVVTFRVAIQCETRDALVTITGIGE